MTSGFGYVAVTRLPQVTPPPPAPSAPQPGLSPGAGKFQDSLDASSAPAGNDHAGGAEHSSPARSAGTHLNEAQRIDGFRLERTTKATRLDRDARPLQGESGSLRNLPSRWENFRSKVEGVMQQQGGASQEDLFLLQLELNEIAFQVETASKVVEHATSGTKTVLQTQA